MDPFTEKLLERTRARRENLQKKMASRPAPGASRPDPAASRPAPGVSRPDPGASSTAKRTREPLSETNSTHTTAPQPSSKPSPSKRSRSGDLSVAPQLSQVEGEENQEPGVVPGLVDPRTDKKPPVGPTSVRSNSSLEKSAARPAITIHTAPTHTQPLLQKQSVNPSPPDHVESQTTSQTLTQTTPPPEPVEAQRTTSRPPPEPEQMMESSAAPEPQRTEGLEKNESQWTTQDSAPGLPSSGAARGAWPAREEAEPREAPPSAAGMKSRLQRLAEQRQGWDYNGDSSDSVPEGPQGQQDPPSSSSAPVGRWGQQEDPPSSPPAPSAPVGRRGRLAHLAAAIGSWEDDLSHPVTRKDNKEEKPNSAWADKMAARDAAAKLPAAAATAAARQPASAATVTAASSKQPAATAAATQRGQASQPSNSSSIKPVASSSEQQTVVDSPVKASRVVPASAQQVPGTPAVVPGASPQKTFQSSSLVVTQSPLKNRGLDFTFSSPKKPDLAAKPLTAGPSGPSGGPQSREKLSAKDPAGTPAQQKATVGPTGVKSFAERFGERRQERTNHNSPAAAAGKTPTAVTPSTRTPAAVPPSTRTAAAAATVTPGVSPSTRMVQERLRAAQSANTATADLTQRQKLERESELAQIRSRFQKGSNNMWKNSKEDEEKISGPRSHPEEPTGPRNHPEIKVVEDVHLQSVDEDDVSTVSSLTCATEPFSSAASNYTSTGNLLAVSPPAATSSPLRILDLRKEMMTSSESVEISVDQKSSSESVEMTLDQRTPSSSSSNEVEQSVDQKKPWSSSREQSVDQSITSAVINDLFEGVYDEEDEEEEDGLNISSMSLLAPLEETVAAVVKSPERRMMTSTPAGSFCGPADCQSKPSKFQRARVTRGGSADAVDDNLPYSVDAYRSIKKKDSDRPDVKQVIVRKEDVSKRLDEPRAAAATVKHRMKTLNEEMNLQQTIIHQASQALNCCTDQEHGKGSEVEAEAERLLLVATERRAMVKAALEQLKTQNQNQTQAGSSTAQEDLMGVSASKGSVSLLDLRLPLKADFVCSAANSAESANHYFFLMIRAGPENTVATPLASTRSALIGDSLSFTTTFTMSDVSSNFEIDVEVYYLVQKRELVTDKRKKPSKSKAITPKRFLAITKTSQTPVLASPGGPNSVRSSNFSLVGSHKLTLASIGQSKFPLTKVPFRCPMEGHISLKLQCQVDCSVEERGFLTMFEDVSGFGAWHRRWCVLSNHCISYWTYPDDEKRKKPIGRLSLASCTSRKVEPANREFCARPNTMELVTVRQRREDDRETLVSQCHSNKCITKNWLSADTKEERNLWMQKLNQVLVDLRMWQPDACYRPQH